ncbi:hypothetical protein [Methanobrevibacter olleyae]|uniref:Adhesin-like protein n=1 Tax=Methanobrevibacter olleyae TaxID=294671 RepID=A0A126QZE5_METOL|nr:hypothetical protein [Methanobrevibacter olleyae]AMK15049.1 adhesin-like protein [Methanobrevibacter olleyae]
MIKDLNKIIIVILFLIFLSISATSAQDNASFEISLNENVAILDGEEIVDDKVNAKTNEDNKTVTELEKIEDKSKVEMNEDNLKGSTSSSFSDLQNLINKAPVNGTLNLDKDYTCSLSDSEIIINKPITIDGKNHVIDGKSTRRILKISGNHVTLKNIKFINANNTNEYNGGAIYWEGNYGKMSNCSFVNNYAMYGGAIYWEGNYGNIGSCSFVNNHGMYGGAIDWYGANGFLGNSSFLNNHAEYDGGAVYCYGDNSTLRDSSFTNNHAGYYGGALGWRGDNSILRDSSFTNNHAGYYGGAIDCLGNNSILRDSSFRNNHAEYDGGAVYLRYSNGSLNACSFVNNTANYYGDAIYVYYNTTNVSACSFSVFRPKNTLVFTVNNLIYYNNHNYLTDYYENAKKIHSGRMNDGITFYNLDSGKHSIQMIYNKESSKFINYIIINGYSYLNASNVYMFYKDGTKYTIKLTDYKGNPLRNQNIQITIANTKYNIKTNNKGYATINLKQKAGKYNIIAKFDGNSDYGPSTIKNTLYVLDSPITKNKNSKIYFGGTFKVRIINANGKHVGAGKTVKFTIAGKTYSKKTNKKGYASLKITLKPRTKTYSITTKYGKFIKKNKITVKPVLTAKSIKKKKAKTIKFYVKLVNTKGKPQAKKTIIFKLKGKTYKIKTNKNGIATLKIKNLRKGNYKIYTEYRKSKIKNTIKIK